jgi:PAS domain S-box-containing protein
MGMKLINGRHNHHPEAVYADANIYKTIIKNANVLIHIDDLDKGKMIWGSDNFMEILGFSAQEICKMGRKYIAKYYHPDDFKKINGIVRYFKENKCSKHTTLFKLRHKNGRQIYFYTTRTVLKRKASGAPWLVLSFSMDVTEPVHAGTQIEELLKENMRIRRKLLIREFTRKELEILGLLCKGMNSSQIGKTLFISPRTVDRHRYNIRKKAKCGNTPQLLNFAIDNGLV